MKRRLLLLGLASLVRTSQTQTGGHLVENVHIAISTAKGLLAGTHSKDRHISKRVYALSLTSRQSAVDDDTIGGVLGVHDVAAVAALDSGLTRAALVDFVVLTAVGGSTNTSGDGVTGLPVGGKVDTRAVLDVLALLGVLRETGLFVDANGVAFGTLVFLLAEVFSVCGSIDTKKI